MKTTFSRGWKWAFGVACAITVFGCFYQPRGTSAENSGQALAAETAPAPENLAPPGSTNEVPIPEEIPPTPPANLSPGVAELVKLAQSGMGDEVLMAYVNKSGQVFHPSVDEIVYLKDLGISESVIAAVIGEGNPTANPGEAAQPFTNNYSNPVDNSAPAPAYAETNSESEANPQVASSEAVTAPLTPQPGGAAPVQQVDVGYFQDALSPYGTWVTLPDYGPCWQPTVVLVNRGWRPYTDRGRWIYTSAGWYWQSDYSWGWAPFHYGRWYCDTRIGWVWVPGATWGPAWVSWRYTDDYCGWAPLPPGARFVGHGFRYHNASVGVSFDFGIRADFYTFVPIGRMCDRTPSRYYVHGASRTTIYRNSVVINNYVRGNNNIIINEGISKDRVAKASRTPIRTVALRDMPTSNNPIGRADRFDGNKLDVFRPNVTRDNSRSRTSSSSLRNPGNPLPSTPSAVTRQIPSSKPQTSRHENAVPPTRSTEPRNTTRVPGTRVETTQPQTTPSQNSQPHTTTRPSSQFDTRRSAPIRPQETQPNSTPRPTPTPSPTPAQPAQPFQRTAPMTPQRNFQQRTTPSGNDAVRPQSSFNAPQQNVIRSAPTVPQQTPRIEQPNNAIPNSLRSLPTERPQPQIAPQQRSIPAPEVNRSLRTERSVPQAIQSVPRQEIQRSQPAQSSRGDRDFRERNR